MLVKGGRFDAARAATTRGIPFAFVDETRDESEPAITVGKCNADWVDKVRAWFGEPPMASPYPVGACLHFWITDEENWPVRCVLWNVDEKKYAAHRGQEHSYTKDLADAHKFESHEEAERHRCDNEQIRDLERELDKFRE
jgi:hypothetical protein